MGKLNIIKIDTHPRGDSGILRWGWVKKNADGTTTPLSLKGYKVAMTVKARQWDKVPDDNKDGTMESDTLRGYNNQMWWQTIDCDDPSQMHGLDPAEGKVIFEFPKQANWVDPGTYYIDIVVENKASHRTTTVMLGQIEVQGHPTNRFTTDIPDSFTDITG